MIEHDFEPEHRPTAYLAGSTDGAPHQFDQSLRYGKPQASAAKAAGRGSIRLGEGTEQGADFLCRDADTGVADFEAQAT